MRGVLYLKMMDKKNTEFCKESEILQTPEIQEKLGEEIGILYELGVECYEIEFLIDFKIKEELIIAS